MKIVLVDHEIEGEHTERLNAMKRLIRDASLTETPYDKSRRVCYECSNPVSGDYDAVLEKTSTGTLTTYICRTCSEKD